MTNRVDKIKKRDMLGYEAEVVDAFSTGSLTVGTTAAPISATSVPTVIGVLVKAGANNSGMLYVGKVGVTALGTDEDTDGFELDAGESVLIPVDDAAKVYVIGSAADQLVSYIIE